MFATWVINTILDVREVIFGYRIASKSNIGRPMSPNPLVSGLSL
jgi:hypothetical protein